MVYEKLTQSPQLHWSEHALERLNERNIDKRVTKVTSDYIMALNHYTTNGCYYYCDTKNDVTYLVRDLKDTGDKIKKTVMTVYSRNPIQMARRICEIKGWKFNNICRDHLFGNCNRSRCKYEHRDLD